MTYFAFLALFLVLPILLLALLAWRDASRGRALPAALQGRSVSATIAILVLVAVAYTTPWDNYLVATGVWWYDRALVTGVTLGWVPLEEYCFFVLQTVMTGLALVFLARRLAAPAPFISAAWRWRSTAFMVAIWTGAALMLVSGWQPGVYLGLELVWALPPIMIQLAFGADILWRHRRLVLAAILGASIYLSLADSLAIGAGTWTIDPAQSLGLYLGGVLPVEEFIFFLLTNTLIVFGVTLAQAEESQARIARLRLAARRWMPGRLGASAWR